MAAITAELALEVSKFQSALQRAQQSVRSFKAGAQSEGGGLGQSLLGGMGKAMAGVGAVLAGALAAAGLGRMFSSAISKAAADEQMQVSMEVLIGDPAKARATIASLRQLGAETPFEFPELADAGKKLIAFGESAENVTAVLARVGDVSSGVGAPISEIAELYGKARVQGRLFSEDINQLTGRGIPIIGELARQFGVAESQVKGLVESGAVNFSHLEQAFISLAGEGGKFGGMMARQSKTLAGLWSTFKDEVGALLLAFGKPIADQLSPMLAQAISLAGTLREHAGRIGSAFAGVFKIVTAVFQELGGGGVLDLLQDSLTLAFKTAVNVLWAGFWGWVRAVGQYVQEFGKNVLTLFSIVTTAEFWAGLGHALLGIALAFDAAMMRVVAKVLAEVKKIPMVGKVVGEADRKVGAAAAMLEKAGREERAKGGVQLDPFIRQAQERLKEAANQVGDAFMQGFQSADKLLDASAEQQRLAETVARIQERMRLNQLEDARKQTAAASGSRGSAAPATPPVQNRLASTPGALASAVNWIMGRSANELILDESKKQTAELQQIKQGINKLVEQRPPAAPSAPPVARPIDLTPRFS